jgi:hypothetical protein
MQTVISEITFTFVDDAMALAAGFKRIALELARNLVAAGRARIMAPIDRLARACDVAGTLSTRDQVRRHKTCAPRRPRYRFDVLRIRAAFRTLRELT